MIDEDGALPDGWTTRQLGECVDVLDKLRRPVNSTERAKRAGDVPYYGATGRVGWIDDCLFDEELVLLGEDGAPFFDKSKSIAYLIDGPSWVNNHAHVLRARAAITLNKYIKYFLDSFDFSDSVQGSTRDKLTQRAMKAIPVALAPLPEQPCITRRLDQVDHHRTSAAAHLHSARTVLDRFRSAVLAAACSGRLTADWREVHPDATADELCAQLINARRIAKTRGLAESADRGLTSETQVELLPSSWSLVRLGDVLGVGTGATPLRKKRAYYDEGTIPWVTSGAVNAGTINAPTELITPLALKETNVKLFPPGTLLVAMYGEGQTRGRVAELRIDAGTNQAVAAVLFGEGTAPLRPFIRLFFEDSYQRIRALSVGGVQPNLNLRKIKDTLLPLPPLEEQAEIVRRAAAALAVADRLLNQIEQADWALDRVSRATLAKAFRGELVRPGKVRADGLGDHAKARTRG